MEIKCNYLKSATEIGLGGVYFELPWDQIRNNVDSIFPELAKNATADSVSGYLHRYKEGHDLYLDVLNKTIPNSGLPEGAKHAGHILLTDFPTKAGIPIPGFSEGGLGKLLADLGIPKGYMCVNLLDTGIGILALSSSVPNLINALSGSLEWSTLVFFNTFVKGGIEIGFGVATENPLLLLSGTANCVAGSISLYKYLKTPFLFGVPVNQLASSFGSGFLTSALIEFIFNKNTDIHGRFQNSIVKGILGGITNTIFKINPALFGIYYTIYFSTLVGKNMARRQSSLSKHLFPERAENFPNIMMCYFDYDFEYLKNVRTAYNSPILDSISDNYQNYISPFDKIKV